MKKGLVEFVNVCAWCDNYTAFVEELGVKYSDKLNVKIYKAGKDFEYIRKYGMLTKSAIIINEKKLIDKVSRSTIEAAFEEAVSLV